MRLQAFKTILISSISITVLTACVSAPTGPTITIMPRERLPWRSPVWASVEPVTAEPEPRFNLRGIRLGHAVGDFRPALHLHLQLFVYFGSW